MSVPGQYHENVACDVRGVAVEAKSNLSSVLEVAVSGQFIVSENFRELDLLIRDSTDRRRQTVQSRK